MNNPSPAEIFTTIALVPESDIPIYRQLYENIRQAILRGQLKAETRLPATRSLAKTLGLSRNTVANAYDQLQAEGYLESRVGSGNYVASFLPDDLLSPSETPRSIAKDRQKGLTFSIRSEALATAPTMTAPIRLPGGAIEPAFRVGLPALDVFPHKIWEKLLLNNWRSSAMALMGFQADALGHPPLREALAQYLGVARGVHCQAEQIIIVSGSQQGIDLTARVLLNPGDAVWMENPGYQGAQAGLLFAGAKLIPVAVDGEGFDIAEAMSNKAEAKLAFVTPSHQFPLGVTMSLARRLALLNWAATFNAWILEDDYDSEYRYTGRPLAALQGLDTVGRVIYLGTFSKVMFPSLRLGYLVVPPELVDAFVSARFAADMHPPILPQAAMADFILEGHFARHIRRMRLLYAERQNLFIQLAERELSGLLALQSADSGMHLIGQLAPGIDALKVSRQARKLGLDVMPLSLFSLTPLEQNALVLGYAGVPESEMLSAVRRLGRAIVGVGD